MDVGPTRPVAACHLRPEVSSDDGERSHAGPGDAVQVKPLAGERTGAAHGEKDGRTRRSGARTRSWHDAPMASDLLSEEWSWRGRRVRWGRWGSGPDVVFCHGTPWSSALWAPYAQALSASYTVHLWDMPGYGTSSMDPTTRSPSTCRASCWPTCSPTGSSSAPHVVAHDIGGAVALRAHLLHGRAYASLALVDVVALAPWGSDYFRLVSEHADVFAAVPPAMHEGALRAYVAGASHRGLSAPALDELVAPWLGEQGQPAFYRQIAQATQEHTDEIEPLYPAWTCPCSLPGAPTTPGSRSTAHSGWPR